MANNNFSVELSTTLNSSQVEKQLKALNAKLTKSTATAIEFKYKNGTLTTAIKEVNQYKDALGNLYTQQKLIDAQTGKMIKGENSITKVSNAITTVKTSTDKWRNSSGELVTEIRKLDSNGKTWITRIREHTDALGKTTKTTTEYTGNNKKLSQTIEEVNDRTKQLNQSQSQAQSSLNKTTTATQTAAKAQKSLAQSFGETVAKVAKFYVATIPIQLVQKALSDAAETVKEYDKAMTEFQKVTSLSSEAIKDLSDSLREVGEETGNTLTQMIDIATTLTKAGYGFDEKTLAQLSEMVALYINTSDEELNAADAASVLISQMKAFGETTQEVEHYLDAINKVSAEFAVSSGDLGKGLTAAGAALSTYGNTYDETIALLTSGENFLPVTDLIDGDGEIGDSLLCA